jgi:hypothetical protein
VKQFDLLQTAVYPSDVKIAPWENTACSVFSAEPTKSAKMKRIYKKIGLTTIGMSSALIRLSAEAAGGSTADAAARSVLPGKGAAQHPFLYAGEWDTRKPQEQSISQDRVLIMRNGNPAQAMIINTATGQIEKEILIPTPVTGTHGQFRHIRMTQAGALEDQER